MDTKELLDSLFLFDGTDFSGIDGKYSVSASVYSKVFADGEDIICDGLPVICSGGAAIVSGEGGSVTVLRRLSPGDTFGAATLFFKGEHRTRVIAEGECTVCFIPREMLELLISREPVCALNYIAFLSERIAFLNRKITAFTAGSSDLKLAIYLSSLPEKDGRVCVPVSLSELSNMLSVGRASLYRSFDALIESGIIKKDGRTILILDREKLENYSK